MLNKIIKKTKIIKFTFTGEHRKVRYEEFYKIGKGVYEWDDSDESADEYDIYTRSEEVEEWKPKEEEDVYITCLNVKNFYMDDIYLSDCDETSFERGLVFPYTEEGKQQAITLSKRMIELAREQ